MFFMTLLSVGMGQKLYLLEEMIARIPEGEGEDGCEEVEALHEVVESGHAEGSVEMVEENGGTDEEQNAEQK